MVRINLISHSCKVEDIAALATMSKWWKADKRAISIYAEQQWMLLEAGCLDEVHWSCMFQDRIVRRRYDKRLRDALLRVALPCLECGKQTLRPKWARKVFCSHACHEEFSRLDLMPTYEQRDSTAACAHRRCQSSTMSFKDVLLRGWDGGEYRNSVRLVGPVPDSLESKVLLTSTATSDQTQISVTQTSRT